jgi:DNA-binding transcriptional ArsR family regulator
VAQRQKFTRIPKTTELIAAGVPAEVIPTYCVLADHANNKTGLCWPKMETLAKTLGRSVRTVQRHLHLLRERGLIEFVERRRYTAVIKTIEPQHGSRSARRSLGRLGR